jgi:uncharacterized phage protein (TIGR02218 family)
LIDMADFDDALNGDLTYLAICWRVIRSDGIALGFTTHDRPLLVSGLHYASTPGMVPSAIVTNDDLEVDNMDVGGALTADAISAADLAAGRYDGAAVTVFMVDWRTPDSGQQVLVRGQIGAVEAGSGADSGFVAALRGPTAALAVTAVETYSPECRAELGDARCRVAMRGRTLRSAVAASDGFSITPTALGNPLGDFVEGRLRVLDGPAAGLSRRIVAADDVALSIDEPLALDPGTRIQLWHGCDKRLETCSGRFANAANFRGEPHVPGGDILTRFGG